MLILADLYQTGVEDEREGGTEEDPGLGVEAVLTVDLGSCEGDVVQEPSGHEGECVAGPEGPIEVGEGGLGITSLTKVFDSTRWRRGVVDFDEICDEELEALKDKRAPDGPFVGLIPRSKIVG